MAACSSFKSKFIASPFSFRFLFDQRLIFSLLKIKKFFVGDGYSILIIRTICPFFLETLPRICKIDMGLEGNDWKWKRFVYYQEDDMWIGWLEGFPALRTQGHREEAGNTADHRTEQDEID
jgi:hypothetical protein